MSTEKLIYEPSETAHWKTLFPAKTQLLGSHNLNEGEELIAEIVNVSIQQIKNIAGKNEEVPVITFKKPVPPMVLNVTNSRTISSLYGDLYTDWIGKYVQIYATQVQAFGQTTMGLRIRHAIPSNSADIEPYREAISQCRTMEELQSVFTEIPKHLKPQLVQAKDEMKELLSA